MGPEVSGGYPQEKTFAMSAYAAGAVTAIAALYCPPHGVPITRYDSRSAGADAYYRVALEVVERG